MTSSAPTEEGGVQFGNTLNFRVSTEVKARLKAQSKRLGMTQAALLRLCIHLGLEALEGLTAAVPREGIKGKR